MSTVPSSSEPHQQGYQPTPHQQAPHQPTPHQQGHPQQNPAYGAPGYGQPDYGQSGYGQPGPGGQGYADPNHGAPGFGASESGAQTHGATAPAPRSSDPYATPTLSRGDRGGTRALFDFKFDSYATPAIVKIVYALTVAVAILGWLGSVLLSFGFGIALLDSRSTEEAGVFFIIWGILSLLFGWIGALLTIAFARMQLELVLATVRTNIAVDAIRTQVANGTSA